jgi:hypothetical protein
LGSYTFNASGFKVTAAGNTDDRHTCGSPNCYWIDHGTAAIELYGIGVYNFSTLGPLTGQLVERVFAGNNLVELTMRVETPAAWRDLPLSPIFDDAQTKTTAVRVLRELGFSVADTPDALLALDAGVLEPFRTYSFTISIAGPPGK